MSRQYLIVGCGAAAWSAAHAIRAHDRDGPVTIVSGEPAPPYARMLLSYWLEGKAGEEAMHPFPPRHFDTVGVDVVYGEPASALDVRQRKVTLANGRDLRYDALLIATGASPARPPIRGLGQPGVFTLWTMGDVRGILGAIRPGGEAVVIGAGFIGMQAVDALVKRGMHCTLVEMLPLVLPRILDGEAARLLEAALVERGVRVLAGSRVSAIRWAGRRSVRKEVALEDGRCLPADLVILATGIIPNLDLARRAGLATATGIVVDQAMQTSAPNVYAAGDVAEGRDLSSGDRAVHAIWPTAVDQGRVAGLNMAGVPATYAGSLSMNALEVLGRPIASAGVFEGDRLEFQEHREPARGLYRKLAFRNGRLVGAVLVGETTDIGLLQAMIRQEADLSRWKPRLARAPLSLGQALVACGGVGA